MFCLGVSFIQFIEAVGLGNASSFRVNINDPKAEINPDINRIIPIKAQNTLGLATPWVMVRNARYRISKTAVLADDLGSFCSHEKSKVSSIAEEIGEALDVDLSI